MRELAVMESNGTLRFRATHAIEEVDGLFDFRVDRGLARLAVKRIELAGEGSATCA